MARKLPIVVIVTGSLLGLLALQPGLDYFTDAPAIDDLARGDLPGFFANQPLMGSLTLFLRAVVIKPVFHANITVVYAVGALPCVAALVWLAARLLRRMPQRPRQDRVLVLLLCVGSLTAIRALHWGHPEDILAAALAVGALLVAADKRAVLAGVMVGAAASSKQWGMLAGLPALLVLPSGRRGFFAAAVGVWALFTVPMLIGDPQRFWTVMHAAGSADPTVILYGDPVGPGAHVNPYDIWLPFATRAPWMRTHELFISGPVVNLAHPLILLTSVALPAVLWWRRRRVTLVAGLQLLALILLARCALDPMSLDYYHLPVVVALAAAAAVGGRRELDFALLVTAGLTVAFVEPAVSLKTVEHLAWLKFTLYAATVVPAAAWLVREVYGVPAAGRVKRASRSPRPQASTSSA
ncbi:MAG: hypothetical protein QOI80_1558 [Solirubrobacteraceae bacterium]|nr:hypothetical protein [Solirubrobacteraceae bacterium]